MQQYYSDGLSGHFNESERLVQFCKNYMFSKYEVILLFRPEKDDGDNNYYNNSDDDDKCEQEDRPFNQIFRSHHRYKKIKQILSSYHNQEKQILSGS